MIHQFLLITPISIDYNVVFDMVVIIDGNGYAVRGRPLLA